MPYPLDVPYEDWCTHVHTPAETRALNLLYIHNPKQNIKVDDYDLLKLMLVALAI